MVKCDYADGSLTNQGRGRGGRGSGRQRAAPGMIFDFVLPLYVSLCSVSLFVNKLKERNLSTLSFNIYNVWCPGSALVL